MAEPVLEWRGDVLYRDGVEFCKVSNKPIFVKPLCIESRYLIWRRVGLFRLPTCAATATREEAVALAEKWAKEEQDA